MLAGEWPWWKNFDIFPHPSQTFSPLGGASAGPEFEKSGLRSGENGWRSLKN
ncbi:hypothetical protein [Polaromonas sp. UBA4122]|uniref:hypothetical protein n=1 Tax=Polaromonas sp. UBA4122 TaxID=1947074 RepID=UPI0025F11F78|nr:hypothetical protein [Polaromonas sp. UBA4122]